MDYKQYFSWDNGILDYDGPYPESDSDALAISMAKWESIVAYLQSEVNEEYPFDFDGGRNTCGLCMRHHTHGFGGIDCGECPVKKFTGLDACEDTPYYKFELTTSLEDAQAELDFLKSL